MTDSPALSYRARLAGAAIAAGALLAAAPAASAEPIPSDQPTSLPQYQGAPAKAEPTRATKPPQHPFLARNPFSNIHNDTWMTDAYDIPGPLGRAPTSASASGGSLGICASLAFDKQGRIVSVCPSLTGAPQARVIDPKTLEVLARFDMPNAPNPPGTKAYQNFTGGGYFFLDQKDQIWSATKTSHLFVLAQRDDGRRLVKVADYDLSGVLNDDERISSALPAFDGKVWFVSKKSGKVGILDPKTRRIRVKRLGEEIENSFAVDRDAAYIVSDKRMYRMSATAGGAPKVDWKSTYKNSGITKPSQVNAGSGTTPTIMSGGYVAITDNDDPMNVVVYRKAKRLGGKKRVVCEVPVFDKGGSATENSLLTAGRSLIVENNYGYQDPVGERAGELTQAGFARIDVNSKGTGCKKVWTNTTERAPTVVPKLSTKSGLIYTYTRDEDPNGSQPWFWSAINFRTGKTAFKQYAGSGLMFNNNYAGLALGPDGTAYLGVIGGMVALRDS